MKLSETQLFSRQISANVIEAIKKAKPNKVGFYSPISQEVNPKAIIDFSWAMKIRTSLPKIHNQTMHFEALYPNDALQENRFGILEPKNQEIEYALDLIIVPLIVFNEHRYRIGFGQGYYDRYLEANPQIQTWGIAYDWQKNNTWLPEIHDQPLQKIFTEKTTY